jgi:hypothetical protein
VQLCGTGELVLHHDVYLGDDFIENMSLERLRKLGVYTLKDIYDHVPDIRKTTLLIDIKGKDNSVIGALMEFYKTEPIKISFSVVSIGKFYTTFLMVSEKVLHLRQHSEMLNTKRSQIVSTPSFSIGHV